MHSIRLPGYFAMLTGASAIATACLLAPAAADVTTSAPAPAPIALRTDPPQETCPGGGTPPCGASGEERDSVESDRDNTKQDIAAAKNDIAAAKNKAQQCPPGSKQCMEDLIGGGAEQHRAPRLAALPAAVPGQERQSVISAPLPPGARLKRHVVLAPERS